LNHRNEDHGFAGVSAEFVVLAEPAVTPKPTERPFHHPASRQDLKTRGLPRPFDNFQKPTATVFDPSDQLTRIAAIGPDQPEPRKFAFDFLEHQLGSVTVLEIRGVDHCRQH